MSDVPFALIATDPDLKPQGFNSIDALARHIHRERGGMAIDMVDVEDLELSGVEGPTPGVTVFTQNDVGARDRTIGHAWLNGRGMEHLKEALRRTRSRRKGGAK